MSVNQTEGKITALYERLSRDDDNAGDSNSIVNQKKYLEGYAAQRGYSNCVHYTDDGWSGGNFERPAWKKLVEDIEAGKVAHVIVKDMSRVGRDYLQTGFYTDVMFRERGVHFIAIANGVDSDDQATSEFAPFLNIMNEWYLRDLSRKQKTAIRVKGESGKPTTNCVIYGYKKDPKDEWMIFEDTHEAIVDRETWELAQKLRKTPKRIDTIGIANPFTGLLYCADCGEKMYNHRSRGNPEKGNYPSDFFDCSSYTLAKQKRYHACRGHYITTKNLRTLVLDTIRTVSTYAISDQEAFLEKVRSASQIRQKEAAKDAKRQLNKNRRRVDELDTIIKKLYESFAVGRISEERFDGLLKDYEAEQKELTASVTEAEEQLSSYEEDTDRAEQFLMLAKKYADFSELTTQMINEFIEKIIVHAPEKVDGDRVQEIEIYLNFIGRFELPAPELSPEEEKRQEQLKRHRIRSRERYQMLKAGEHTVGKPFKLTCKCCGKEFESKRSNTLFCGANCRAKYYRQQAAEDRRRECVCGYCGKTFIATRRDKKFCCEDCRYKAQIRRQCERKAEKRKQETAVPEDSVEQKTA